MAESTFLQKFANQGGEETKTLKSIDKNITLLVKLTQGEQKQKGRNKRKEAQAAKRKSGDVFGKLSAKDKKTAEKEGGGILKKIFGKGGLGKLLTNNAVLIAGLATVVGGAIFAYFKSPKFRKLINDTTKIVWTFTRDNILKPTWGWIKEKAPEAKVWIENKLLTPAWNWIKEKAPAAYKVLEKEIIKPAFKFIKDGFINLLPPWIQNVLRGGGSMSNERRNFNTGATQRELSEVQGALNRDPSDEEKKKLEAKKKILEDLVRRTQNSEATENKIADLQKNVDIKQGQIDKPGFLENNPVSQSILKGAVARGEQDIIDRQAELEAYQKETQRIAKHHGLLESLKERSGYQEPQELQTGGPLRVPGSGSGDKVPMMLPAGSFVMNRNAAGFQNGGMIPTMLEPGENVYGPGSWNGMHQMMNSLIPRFQTGGVVEYITGDRSHNNYAGDHGGGNYHEHIGFESPAQMTAAAKYLEDAGFYIGSRNDGQHADTSLHYSDRAFDVPFYPNHTRKGYSDDKAGEEKFSAEVRKALREGGYPVAGASGGGGGGGGGGGMGGMMSNIGGILSGIGGQMGELFSGLIGAFDEVFPEVGNLFSGITSLFTGGGGGGGYTGQSNPLSGSTKEQAKMMYDYVKGKGYSSAQAKGIIANIYRESTFNPAAVGDSGSSHGLFQMHAGRSRKMRGSVPNWSSNWKGQIDQALTDDVGPQYKSATSSMSAGDAAYWWQSKFERPADSAAGGPNDRKQRDFIASLGFQNGGVVNMRGSSSQSDQRFEQAQQKFADRIAEGVQPVVIPVPSGGGGGGGSVVQNPGTQTAPPNLSDGPSSLQAAEYLYRLNMANAF